MNKIYKLIWNAREQAYVVTSELARKSGKVVGAKVVTTVIGALALTANVAQAQCVSTSEQNQICTNAAGEVVISDRDRPDGKDIAFIGIPSVDPITSQEGVFDILGLADGQNIRVEVDRTDREGSLWGINSGTGGTTVDISGNVISSGNEMIPGDTDTPKFDDAVSITNSEDATNLTVDQTASSSTIEGKNIGITTSNSGKGSTNINVAGKVHAKVGIYADNGQNSKAININQAETGNIEGSVNGIVVNNQGIEAININISGIVTGKGTGTGSIPVDTDDTIDPMNPNGDIFNTGSGIIAENHENATDINIHQLEESSKIQGTATGISAVNSGTGSTTITTVGTVIADGPEKNGTGISAYNGETANAINITQTTGSIEGKETGIVATNLGKGDTKITTGGNVTGTSGAGIQATNIDWADSGEKRGIAVNQTGGSITGGTDGISAINTTGGVVSVETSGQVTGNAGAGILAVSGIAPVSEVDENADNVSIDDWYNSQKLAGKNLADSSLASSEGIKVTQNGGNITGFNNGIEVNNHGSGATNIEINGKVKATSTETVLENPKDLNSNKYNTSNGIIVSNGANTTDINISQLKESSEIRGGAAGISTVNSGTGSTTINTAGKVIADGPGINGTGISAYNGETANAINITQTTGSIEGKETGIVATNLGKGDTKITTGGNVTGTSGAGIQATNIDWADSGEKRGIAVNQTGGSITGGTDGISAINTTGGAVSVETSGQVTGNAGAGILAVSGTADVDTDDVSIDDWYSSQKLASKNIADSSLASSEGINVIQKDGDITGFNSGIEVNNYGSGATNIEINGKVKATSTETVLEDSNDLNSSKYNTSNGIIVSNGANTTDINISQLKESSEIRGGAAGISTVNSGTGSTTINTAGKVIADGPGINGTGISAYNGETANAINITQTTGSIEGKETGIAATNLGKGDTKITTGGDVTGTSGAGIQATNINWADSGEKRGIAVNQTGGSITGGTDGISAINTTGGAVSVETSGQVTGNAGAGILAVSGTADVDTDDVSIDDWYSSQKLASKNIADSSLASSEGINVIQKDGDITGFNSGIEVNNYGSGATNIEINGKVKATSTETVLEDSNDLNSSKYNTSNGIIVSNGANTTDININQKDNSDIQGGAAGISAVNSGTGSTTINTAGKVIADGPGINGTGISAYNGETANAINITQTTGSIEGKETGIVATNLGKGDTKITTGGNVTGTSGAGIQATNIDWADSGEKRGIAVNQTGGSITGGTDGISAINTTGGAVSVETSGQVTGNAGAGILAVSGTADADDVSIDDWYNSQKLAGKNIADSTRASSEGINVTQNDGDITGFNSGIEVNNHGSGATNIKINGKVKATSTETVLEDSNDLNSSKYNTSNGIIVSNGANTTDINISQLKESSEIRGGAAGISTVNSGTGSTTINTAGKVIADGPGINGTGISAYNGETANAINITQTTGSIEGKETGIVATNLGKGDTKITTGGNVTGTSGAGIQATNIDWADSGEKRGIAVNQTGGSITGGTDGISAINMTGGAVSIETSGKVAGGTGAGISTNGLPASNSSIILNKGADVSAASGIAIEDGDSNSLVTINSGAKVTGNINLGHGSDILTINNGADITGLTMLDGGNDIDNGKDSSNDQLYLNTNLRGSSTSNSAGDVGIVNWENIHLGQSARLTLTGDLNTQNLNIGSGAEVQLDKIDNSSGKNEVAISGNVNNAGNINLVNDNVGDRLTIQGDYHGEKGSKLLLEVTPEQNNADKLHIGGNASGETAIDLTEVSGLGASTAGTNGIEIVSVDGTADGDIFTLLRDHVDAGAYEYRLQKSEDNKWNLYSEKMQETGTKTTYRREVPLYSAVSAQLHQADSLMLGDMHKRIGATPTPDERMSWGRVIANRSDIRQNGTANTRSKGNYSGLQVGSDIWSNNGLRIGGYLGYLHGNLDVNGFASGINGKVGKNSTKSYFLGAYGNYTRDNGAYMDVVLQGARHNVDIKPDGTSNSKQKGHGVTASIEVGQPFAIGSSSWKFEPQAQIIHQWLDLNDTDISGNTTVKQDHDNAWLFRLGGRLEGNYQVNKGVLHPYARVNFFYSPNGANHTTFKTKAASTTLNAGASHANTEMAIGGSYDITDKVKAYGEIGHTWSNGGDSHVKSPVNGSVGLKVNW
ncbi:autotransporter outer membrane beta-barrel domain-containing protein [Snodgrassella alvi]|uniref:autotransporter outer membrane beta-barrel domain-containing protein n=1 Tax=Snodgrassella alvi TaxID=1196083 RepID=UPI00352E69E3